MNDALAGKLDWEIKKDGKGLYENALRRRLRADNINDRLSQEAAD
jgi:hypothetical protein